MAFDAFRNKPFHEALTYLTFDGTTVNIGGAFDPDTGKFIAPVKGVYSFTFHGLTQDGTATYIKIIQNGRNVAGAYRRHEGEGDEEHESLVSFFPDQSFYYVLFLIAGSWIEKGGRDVGPIGTFRVGKGRRSCRFCLSWKPTRWRLALYPFHRLFTLSSCHF